MHISTLHVRQALQAIAARPAGADPAAKPAELVKPAAATPITRVDTFEPSSTESDRAEAASLQPPKSAPTKFEAPVPAQVPPIVAQEQALKSAEGAAKATGAPQRTFSPKDRDALIAAWGSRTGDARYSADYDLDGDGVVGSSDLAQLLGSFREEAPGGQVQTPAGTQPDAPVRPAPLTREALFAAWGKRTGQEGFDSAYDLDGDGQVNSADLAQLLGRESTAAAPPENREEEAKVSVDINGLIKSWGARKGDAGFSGAFDLDGDGVIGSSDLARLLGRSQGGG